MGVWLRHCYVYLIGYAHDPLSPVKIGMTGDMYDRLSSLQSANPMKLVVKCEIGPFPRKEAKRLESQFHRKLLGYNIRGEWFEHECIKDFMEIANSYPRKTEFSEKFSPTLSIS